MKHLILIAIVTFSIQKSRAQLVYNGGFEITYKDNWGNTLPQNWVPNFWGMIIDSTGNTTDEPYKGRFCQWLYNDISKGGGAYDRAVGRLANRFKLTCLPTKLSAFVLYFPNIPNEKFIIKSVLFNRNSPNAAMDTIAVGFIEPTTPGIEIKTWTKFEGTIEYRRLERPDSAIVTVHVSQPNSVSDFAYMLVDEINFSDTVAALSADEPLSLGYGIVSIYPNPATDAIQVRINVAKENNYILTLYDISGKEVLSKNATGSNNSQIVLNTKSLANGTYFLKVSTEDNSINTTQKIIILKP